MYIVEASSGEDAIVIFKKILLKKCKIHVVLMDIEMGKGRLSGFEAAAKIRSVEHKVLRKTS